MPGLLKIGATFERIADRFDLADWRTRGVYINLGGDPVRTCRVGEGWVDSRASAAWRRQDERVIACDLGATVAAKQHAQIVEWLLLEEYRWRVGRLPRRNHQGGKSTIVGRALARRDRIKVVLRGCSPLSGRRLGSPIHVDIEWDDEDGLVWTWA